MYSIRQFSAFYNLFQVTSGQMTTLPGHFPSPEVTWRFFLSRDCLLLRATALYVVKCTVYAGFRPSIATSRWLPVKWRHFRVTSGLLRSRVVTSCDVTASFYELQPCRNWNVQYTPVFGLLKSLPGALCSNDGTSGSLTVTWGHVTSFPVTWPPSCAGYSPVGSEMYSTCQFSAFYSHFQETSGQITSLPDHFRSPEVTWRHFLSRDFLLLRATGLLEVKCTVYASFRPSKQLPGDFRSNDITCGSPLVTWGDKRHFLSPDCLLLRATAL